MKQFIYFEAPFPSFFIDPCRIIYPVSEDRYESNNSMDDILKELDKENARIIISKDIRRFRKIVTVVSGLQGRSDVELITRELKNEGWNWWYLDRWPNYSPRRSTPLY